MIEQTQPTDALEPCPFCGAKAFASVNKGESLWSHDIVDWTRVHCTNDDCNAQTEPTCEGYEPSAIEAWNRRVPKPTPEDSVLEDAALWRRMVQTLLDGDSTLEQAILADEHPEPTTIDEVRAMMKRAIAVVDSASKQSAPAAAKEPSP